MARGSILERQAKDGTTTFYIKYRDAAGHQVKRAVGKSRRVAETELAKAIAASSTGELHGSRETFAAYADRWIVDHSQRVEHATEVDYRSTLRNHLLPYFGTMPLRKITADHVRAYVAAKLDGSAPVRETPPGRHGRVAKKLAPKTVNNHVGLLGLILGHATEDGLINRNPAASRDRRRPLKVMEPHRERDYLKLTEVPIYLDACSPFWAVRAQTLLLTGMRIGELIALEWSDIDWIGGAIVVRRAFKKGGVGSTKGDEEGRRIDMGPRLAAALRDEHARQGERCADDPDLGLVFPSQSGGYDDAGFLLDRHREALKAAGLRQSLRNHDLRHTSAAVWLSLGYSMEYVRRQMGHKQITTTIRQYGHLEPTLMPEAAERTEIAMLTGSGTTLVPPPHHAEVTL